MKNNFLNTNLKIKRLTLEIHREKLCVINSMIDCLCGSCCTAVWASNIDLVSALPLASTSLSIRICMYINTHNILFPHAKKKIAKVYILF